MIAQLATTASRPASRTCCLPAPSAGFTALVTGALSRDGATLARELAAAGHHLTLVADRGDGPRVLAAEFARTYGTATETIVCDVADARDRTRLARVLSERGLTVSVLVNAPATAAPAHPADRSLERELAAIHASVEAIVGLCGLLAPTMAGRGSGAVLNVVADVALTPRGASLTAGACRAFVLEYTETLRSDLRATGVTVTTLSPRLCRTWGIERALQWSAPNRRLAVASAA